MKKLKSKPTKGAKKSTKRKPIANKKRIKRIDSYRDLEFNTVMKYADKHSLNIDSPENYREAAIACFNENNPISIVDSSPIRTLIAIKTNVDCILKNKDFTPEDTNTFLSAISKIMGAVIEKYA